MGTREMGGGSVTPGPDVGAPAPAVATPRPAASVLLVRLSARDAPEPLEVYMIRRNKGMKFLGGFYAFPGGQLDPNEDTRFCATRELFEEVGVRIDPETLIDVGRWVTPAFAPRAKPSKTPPRMAA